MTVEERIKLYSEIEKIRGKPLIAYITSIRPNAVGLMAPDVVPFFIRQIQGISSDTTEVDVLLISYGGDAVVSWRLVSLLRERFSKVGIIVPYAAYSAATLFALGADEIYMHPFANLGPVDPQLTYRKPAEKDQPPIEINYSAEDLKHYLKFIKDDVGISDQEQLEKAFEFICKDIGAIPIGFTKKSTNLSYSMGEKLLKLHMEDQNKVKAIIEKLNSSFYHHGYPVGRNEAIGIGLPVAESDPNLDKLIWQVWENFENDIQCNTPYNPLEVMLNSTQGARLLAPIPQLNLPMNLSPQLMQNLLQQILQSQQIGIEMIPSAEAHIILAMLESTHFRSECGVTERIFAMRLPDSNIRINRIPIRQGWTHSAQTQ